MMVKKVGMWKPAMGANLDITGQGVKKSVLGILTQCILFGKHLSFYKIANGRNEFGLSAARQAFLFLQVPRLTHFAKRPVLDNYFSRLNFVNFFSSNFPENSKRALSIRF